MKAVERLVKTTEGERVRLGLRNIYILPTRFGWLWLGGVLLVLVVGIQTQINGPLLLGFLMLALFLLTLHLTHFNLQGLELSCADPSPGFADSALAYPLSIRCPHRVDGLRLGLAGRPKGPPRTLGPGVHRRQSPLVTAAAGPAPARSPHPAVHGAPGIVPLLVSLATCRPPADLPGSPIRPRGPLPSAAGWGAGRGRSPWSGRGKGGMAGSGTPSPRGQPQSAGLEARGPGQGELHQAVHRP
jgi:hypothetical protein